ncbi:MAG: M15 family metallopeptidase [Polyangiales bacterium]
MAPASKPAEAEAPPAQLACLARLYVGTAEKRGDAWVLVLPDQRVLPWDDRRAKTLDQKLDDADLEDVFSIPYPRGEIAPVTDPAEDPGRIRSTALLEATYGNSREAVRKQLVPWTFRGQTLLVHARAKPAFERVAKRLQAPSLAPYFEGMGGTFNWRPIAGTDRPSAHSFGISLDLNPQKSHYWRNDPKAPWKNAIPREIVEAFEAEGFVWGGRWFHYDTMHFEWRPELFSCSP